MFGRPIRLFKLLGFTVRMDISWIFIAVLVTWSLAAGLFPHYYPGLSRGTYWWMGLAGAVGLFASILFHEFWHSLVARRNGLPISGITLFIFGGVSEMSEEPQSPGVEFVMAIAGPAASFALALGFLAAVTVTTGMFSLPVRSVLLYLAWINALLGVFNLLPAFPLDGGRVLRSILWHVRGNLQWATRVASAIGSGFGVAMIVLGIITFIYGNLIGGIWWFLIGLFLRNASQMSYRQLRIPRALEGERVGRFMKPDIVTVSPSVTLIPAHGRLRLPLPLQDVPCRGERQAPRGRDGQPPEGGAERQMGLAHREGDKPIHCTEGNTIEPDTDATKALEKMSRRARAVSCVVDRGKLVGILALRDP
jgi:Zn-dependent protease